MLGEKYSPLITSVRLILVRPMRAILFGVAFIATLTSAISAKQSRCDAALHQIDKLLAAYEKEHPLKHFPSTFKEFQKFAAAKRVAVDLSVFSQFTYDR